MTTLNAALDEAKDGMAQIHAGIESAREGAARITALDKPELTGQLDAGTVRGLRRELSQLVKALERTERDANDAHAALNDIAQADGVISPMFGK